MVNPRKHYRRVPRSIVPGMEVLAKDGTWCVVVSVVDAGVFVDDPFTITFEDGRSVRLEEYDRLLVRPGRVNG